MKKKNPFRISYLSIVAVCFVVIGSAFVCISQISYKAETKRFQQQKVESIMREFENQLQLMEDISLRVASNYEFQPYYFKGKVDREKSMLKTFIQYRYTLPLVDDYFLFYGDSYVYRSTDSTLNLSLYLKEYLADETECQILLQEITDLQKNFSAIWSSSKILSFSKKLYILIPFRAKGDDNYDIAVLAFAVGKDDLEERFQFISGGYEGKLALYQESGLLYCNEEALDIRNEKKVHIATSNNGLYSLYFLPESGASIFSNQFWSQFLLILADILLIVAIAFIWADTRSICRRVPLYSMRMFLKKSMA